MRGVSHANATNSNQASVVPGRFAAPREGLVRGKASRRSSSANGGLWKGFAVSQAGETKHSGSSHSEKARYFDAAANQTHRGEAVSGGLRPVTPFLL